MDKRILVTGGAGFIGSNFIHYMFKKHPNYEIVNLDKLTYAGDLHNLVDITGHKKNYKFIRGDIANKELVRYILETFRIQYIVHFAAMTHVDKSIKDPDVFVHDNIVGTHRLLEVAKQYGGIRKIVTISSDEVYGSLPLESKEKFTEESPLNPNNPYSASKAAAEFLARSYFITFKMPILITRSSNNFGPRQHPEKLIPLVITNALKGEPIPVYGDGQNVRDWLYVEDNCNAIDLVLHKGRVGEVYNISAGNELTNMEVITKVLMILATISKTDYSRYKRLITFVKDRPGHDKKYSLDSDKIKMELGWVNSCNSSPNGFINALYKTVLYYFYKE